MDLNNDGHLDMITGQYHPGDVTMFAGTGTGFKPGVKLEQYGNPAAAGNDFNGGSRDPMDPESFSYWNYSSAAFGDLTGDGLQDLVVGGSVMRLSKNVGTKEKPKFGKRELLMDVNGEPLKMARWSKADIAANQAKYGEQWAPSLSGTGKIQPVIVDWDGDGVLDILATDHYRGSQSLAVGFFRGVKTKDGLRFKQGVDLLAAKGGVKALPGSGNRLYVEDWNKDGVNDLIIGASIATTDGVFNDVLSWEWEDVNGVQSAGKDPGRYPTDKPRVQEVPSYDEYAKMYNRNGDKSEDELKKGHADWSAMLEKMNAEEQAKFDKGGHKMIHQGRVYVMLGEDTGTKAVIAKFEPKKEGKKKSKKRKKRVPPVQFSMMEAKSVQAGGTVDLTLDIDVKQGWYIYAPTGNNESNGMTETVVTFALPDGFELAGDLVLPPHHAKGMYEIYDGQDIRMTQRIKAVGAKPGEYEITANVRYQTCNKDMCLPPASEQFTATVVVK